MGEEPALTAKRMMEATGPRRRILVCDSQVHAPDTPHATRVAGISEPDLLRQMQTAGVDRCVIIPLEAPGPDPSANNAAALAMARAHPDRFAVMGRFDVSDPRYEQRLAGWPGDPQLVGLRINLKSEPNRSLLIDGKLDWFWSAAERLDIPVMVLAPGMFDHLDRIAIRHPQLRLALDHMGVDGQVKYHDFDALLPQVVALARHPNIAVKASGLPAVIDEPFPFPSLHEPIQRLVAEFGAYRVFWGSDLTRLPCSYSDWVRTFSEELPFLNDEDKEWILGSGLVEWLGWH
jgi:L-fuconolactonase